MNSGWPNKSYDSVFVVNDTYRPLVVAVTVDAPRVEVTVMVIWLRDATCSPYLPRFT